jgi:hypothetical protein
MYVPMYCRQKGQTRASFVMICAAHVEQIACPQEGKPCARETKKQLFGALQQIAQLPSPICC